MLDAIRRELALATVEPTGGPASLCGKWCDPVNKTPQALVLQIQSHLESTPVSVFGEKVDYMDVSVAGSHDNIFVILNPRNKQYDEIGSVLSKVRLAHNNRAKEEDGSVIEVIGSCAPALVKTFAWLVRGLGPVYRAKDVKVVEDGNSVLLKAESKGYRTTAKLENIAAQVRAEISGTRVYEAQPTFTVKNRL